MTVFTAIKYVVEALMLISLGTMAAVKAADWLARRRNGGTPDA